MSKQVVQCYENTETQQSLMLYTIYTLYGDYEKL